GDRPGRGQVEDDAGGGEGLGVADARLGAPVAGRGHDGVRLDHGRELHLGGVRGQGGELAGQVRGDVDEDARREGQRGGALVVQHPGEPAGRREGGRGDRPVVLVAVVGGVHVHHVRAGLDQRVLDDADGRGVGGEGAVAQAPPAQAGAEGGGGG